MIRFEQGDIFKSGCDALVNPVNCVGVMGAGLAREFRALYPDACEPYFRRCALGILEPGGLVSAHRGELCSPRWIIHLATKRHFKHPSRLAYIGLGLDNLAEQAPILQVKSVAIPALGCGLGGLDWRHVRQQFEAFLGGIDFVEWVVFEPK